MAIINVIWTTIKFVWTLTTGSVKDTVSALWKIIKAAITNIRLYNAASALERGLRRASCKSALKIWAVSAAIVILTGFGVWGVYKATVGSLLHFLPVFVLNAAGYLTVMLLLDVAVKAAERLSLRVDVVCNAKKIIEFAVRAFLPWLILAYFRNPSDQNALNLVSCYMAFMPKAAYGKIRKNKAAAPAPATTQA